MDSSLENQNVSTQTAQKAIPVLDQPLQIDLEALAKSFIKAYKISDPWTLTDIAHQIRKALNKTNASLVQQLIETGAVVYMIKIFDKRFFQRTRLLMECSWIMINIAADEAKCVAYLVSLGVIPKLIPFLKHPDFETRRNVVWMFQNIAMDSKEYRDMMLREGIVKVLDYMLSSFILRKRVVVNAAGLISALTLRPYPDFNIIRPLIKYLGYFLENFNSSNVIEDTLRGLSNVTDGNEDQIQHVLDLKPCPCSKLIKLLKTKDSDTRTYALRTIGNLLTGDDSQTTIVISNGGVPALAELLDNSRKLISREACWALSNIMASGHAHIDEVFQHNEGEIIRKLINMIQTKEMEIAKECLYCICNACLSGNARQAAQLVREDVIRVLIDLIKAEDTDAKVLILCVESIRGILENLEDRMFFEDINKSYVMKKIAECNGLQTIEKLQNHTDSKVYATVARLIDEQFEHSES